MQAPTINTQAHTHTHTHSRLVIKLLRCGANLISACFLILEARKRGTRAIHKSPRGCSFATIMCAKNEVRLRNGMVVVQRAEQTEVGLSTRLG